MLNLQRLQADDPLRNAFDTLVQSYITMDNQTGGQR